VIIEEYREWARAHDLDPNLQGTFMAWADSLPGDRRRPSGEHATFRDVAVDTVAYHDQDDRRVRTRTMRLRTEPATAPATTPAPVATTLPHSADFLRWVATNASSSTVTTNAMTAATV